MDVVTEQPSLSKVNNTEEVKSTLPASLKLLADANEVTVKQHIDSAEVVLCCFNRPCRYSVYIDGQEEQLLYIQEASECYARQVMGAARGFALKFSDNDMIDVIKVVRPQTCSRGSCGICCTLPTLDVQTPPGVSVGTITERRTCCLPTYDIRSADDRLLYSLSLVCHTCKSVLCCDNLINITDTSGQKVAWLMKQANCQEFIGRTNTFTLQSTRPQKFRIFMSKESGKFYAEYWNTVFASFPPSSRNFLKKGVFKDVGICERKYADICVQN